MRKRRSTQIIRGVDIDISLSISLEFEEAAIIFKRESSLNKRTNKIVVTDNSSEPRTPISLPLLPVPHRCTLVNIPESRAQCLWPWTAQPFRDQSSSRPSKLRLRRMRDDFVDLARSSDTLKAERVRLLERESTVAHARHNALALMAISQWKSFEAAQRHVRRMKALEGIAQRCEFGGDGGSGGIGGGTLPVLRLLLTSVVGRRCWLTYLDQTEAQEATGVASPASEQHSRELCPWRRLRRGLRRCRAAALREATDNWIALDEWERVNDAATATPTAGRRDRSEAVTHPLSLQSSCSTCSTPSPRRTAKKAEASQAVAAADIIEAGDQDPASAATAAASTAAPIRVSRGESIETEPGNNNGTPVDCVCASRWLQVEHRALCALVAVQTEKEICSSGSSDNRSSVAGMLELLMNKETPSKGKPLSLLSPPSSLSAAATPPLFDELSRKLAQLRHRCESCSESAKGALQAEQAAVASCEQHARKGSETGKKKPMAVFKTNKVPASAARALADAQALKQGRAAEAAGAAQAVQVVELQAACALEAFLAEATVARLVATAAATDFDQAVAGSGGGGALQSASSALPSSSLPSLSSSSSPKALRFSPPPLGVVDDRDGSDPFLTVRAVARARRHVEGRLLLLGACGSRSQRRVSKSRAPVDGGDGNGNGGGDGCGGGGGFNGASGGDVDVLPSPPSPSSPPSLSSISLSLSSISLSSSSFGSHGLFRLACRTLVHQTALYDDDDDHDDGHSEKSLAQVLRDDGASAAFAVANLGAAPPAPSSAHETTTTTATTNSSLSAASATVALAVGLAEERSEVRAKSLGGGVGISGPGTGSAAAALAADSAADFASVLKRWRSAAVEEVFPALKHKSSVELTARLAALQKRRFTVTAALHGLGVVHAQRVARSFLGRRGPVRAQRRFLLGWQAPLARAVSLQACARGYLARKQWGLALAEFPRLLVHPAHQRRGVERDMAMGRQALPFLCADALFGGGRSDVDGGEEEECGGGHHVDRRQQAGQQQEEEGGEEGQQRLGRKRQKQRRCGRVDEAATVTVLVGRQKRRAVVSSNREGASVRGGLGQHDDDDNGRVWPVTLSASAVFLGKETPAVSGEVAATATAMIVAATVAAAVAGATAARTREGTTTVDEFGSLLGSRFGNAAATRAPPQSVPPSFSSSSSSSSSFYQSALGAWQGHLAPSLSRHPCLSAPRQRLSALGFLAACVAVQAFTRGCLGKREAARRRFRTHCAAAVHAQKKWRGLLARRRLKELARERKKKELARNTSSSSPTSFSSSTSVGLIRDLASSSKERRRRRSRRGGDSQQQQQQQQQLQERRPVTAELEKLASLRVSLRSRGPEARLLVAVAFARMASRMLGRCGAAVQVQRLCRGHLARLEGLKRRLDKEEELGMARRTALRHVRALATKENRARAARLKEEEAVRLKKLSEAKSLRVVLLLATREADKAAKLEHTRAANLAKRVQQLALLDDLLTGRGGGGGGRSDGGGDCSGGGGQRGRTANAAAAKKRSLSTRNVANAKKEEEEGGGGKLAESTSRRTKKNSLAAQLTNDGSRGSSSGRGRVDATDDDSNSSRVRLPSLPGASPSSASLSTSSTTSLSTSTRHNSLPPFSDIDSGGIAQQKRLPSVTSGISRGLLFLPPFGTSDGEAEDAGDHENASAGSGSGSSGVLVVDAAIAVRKFSDEAGSANSSKSGSASSSRRSSSLFRMFTREDSDDGDEDGGSNIINHAAAAAAAAEANSSIDDGGASDTNSSLTTLLGALITDAAAVTSTAAAADTAAAALPDDAGSLSASLLTFSTASSGVGSSLAAQSLLEGGDTIAEEEKGAVAAVDEKGNEGEEVVMGIHRLRSSKGLSMLFNAEESGGGGGDSQDRGTGKHTGLSDSNNNDDEHDNEEEQQEEEAVDKQGNNDGFGFDDEDDDDDFDDEADEEAEFNEWRLASQLNDDELPLPLPEVVGACVDAETGEPLGASLLEPLTFPEALGLGFGVTPVEARAARLAAEAAARATTEEALSRAAEKARRRQALREEKARVRAVNKAARQAARVVPLLPPEVLNGMSPRERSHALAERRVTQHLHDMEGMLGAPDKKNPLRPVLNLSHRETRLLFELCAKRDRNQLHVMTLVASEEVEEVRRHAELKAKSVNPQAARWEAKKHAKERKRAKLLITRIKHDHEIALVAQMASMGLIS